MPPRRPFVRVLSGPRLRRPERSNSLSLSEDADGRQKVENRPAESNLRAEWKHRRAVMFSRDTYQYPTVLPDRQARCRRKPGPPETAPQARLSARRSRQTPSLSVKLVRGHAMKSWV